MDSFRDLLVVMAANRVRQLANDPALAKRVGDEWQRRLDACGGDKPKALQQALDESFQQAIDENFA